MGREMLARIDIDLVFDPGYRNRRGLGADARQIGAPRHQRVIAHPDDVCGKLIRHLGARRRADQEIATGDIDLVRERDRDGVARSRRRLRALVGEKFLHPRGLAGTGDRDGIAGIDGSGCDCSGITAEIEIRSIDPLHRKTERLFGGFTRDVDGLEIVEQAWPMIPGRLVRQPRNVVAVSGRDRNRHDRSKAELRSEAAIFGNNALEDVRLIGDEIDLVHRQDDMTQAKQRANQGMSSGLHQNALARIDQEDGQVGVRCSGRHVPCVLLVARRVGDDERPLGRGEKAIGDIDGDALLPLGLEPVHQKGEVDVISRGAVAYRVLGQRGQLILEDQLRVMQEAADQGGFAVVHRSASQEPEQVLALRLRSAKLEAVHQK